MGLGPFLSAGFDVFQGVETLFSKRPDARVASSQFIPRAVEGRAPARSVCHGTGASGRCEVGTQRSSALSRVDRTL
jgi:hypothetical protein